MNTHRIFQYIICLSVFGFLAPQILAQADNQPTILVDSIPSDAVYINDGSIGLPLESIKGKSDTEIEQMLAYILSSDLVPTAKQSNASFLCLLPDKGDDVHAFSIPGNDTKLMLSLKNPRFAVVFYKGGHIETSHVSFSTGKPEAKRSTVGANIAKVSMPSWATASSWVYLNLPRIQGWAVKCGSPEVFLEASGSGKPESVIMPGMKEPLQFFFEDGSAIKVTWYVNSPDGLKAMEQPGPFKRSSSLQDLMKSSGSQSEEKK